MTAKELNKKIKNETDPYMRNAIKNIYVQSEKERKFIFCASEKDIDDYIVQEAKRTLNYFINKTVSDEMKQILDEINTQLMEY